MGVALLASVLPFDTRYAEINDERWNLIKVFQAVEVCWAIWIFNSVFGKTAQQWISSGINRRKFGDGILLVLTGTSLVYLGERIISTIFVKPWFLPVQLFFERFFLLMVLIAYAAISANLYLANNVEHQLAAKRANSMIPSRLFLQVATVTILPIVGALFAQCLVAGLATGYNWQLELIVIVAVTWGFGVQCVVLNTARFKIYKYLNGIKPFMMPLQQAKEQRMMRKLNSLRLFTYLGILNVGASAARLFVLSAKRVHLNHPIAPTITRKDTVIIISMGFIELLFVGFSAAAAADLFQVGHFTATSPFKKQLQMTNEKMVGIAQGGVVVSGMAQAISGAQGSDKSSAGAAQSLPKAPGTASAIEGELRIIQENDEWIRSMVQTAEEQAMWWKRLGTITLKEFMTFPNPISEAEIRIWMLCVFVINCLAVPLDIYYGSPALYWVTFYLVFTRSLFGVRLDPLAYIIIWYVKPLIVNRWGLMEDLLVAGPPRRQAMVNPVPPLFVMSILWHCGWPYGSRWLAGALAATTLAQGLYDVCLGCAVFWLMIKTGIATQAACDVCTLNYEFVVERYCLSKPVLSKSGSTVTSPKFDEGSKQHPSLPRNGPNVVAPSVPSTAPQLQLAEQGLNGAC